MLALRKLVLKKTHQKKILELLKVEEKRSKNIHNKNWSNNFLKEQLGNFGGSANYSWK
jgi:hypothetical protein